jgi:hypothetical protein
MESRLQARMPAPQGRGRISIVTGLCSTCIHAKEMRNDRGSVFLFCLLSRTDTRYPKYPRLPVLRCEGYEPSIVLAGKTEDESGEGKGRG